MCYSIDMFCLSTPNFLAMADSSTYNSASIFSSQNFFLQIYSRWKLYT